MPRTDCINQLRSSELISEPILQRLLEHVQFDVVSKIATTLPPIKTSLFNTELL